MIPIGRVFGTLPKLYRTGRNGGANQAAAANKGKIVPEDAKTITPRGGASAARTVEKLASLGRHARKEGKKELQLRLGGVWFECTS